MEPKINKNIQHKIITKLDDDTFIKLAEQKIIPATEDEIKERRFNKIIRCNPTDIEKLYPNGVSCKTISSGISWFEHCFDEDTGTTIIVDSFGLHNMEQIKEVINEPKILEMIERILYYIDNDPDKHISFINNGCNGIKMGIKNDCFIFLKLRDGSNQNIINIRLSYFELFKPSPIIDGIIDITGKIAYSLSWLFQ